jgi:hypothetical protein
VNSVDAQFADQIDPLDDLHVTLVSFKLSAVASQYHLYVSARLRYWARVQFSAPSESPVSFTVAHSQKFRTLSAENGTTLMIKGLSNRRYVFCSAQWHGIAQSGGTGLDVTDSSFLLPFNEQEERFLESSKH